VDDSWLLVVDGEMPQEEDGVLYIESTLSDP